MGAFVDTDGTWRTPTGITLSGGVAASYEETADGSHTRWISTVRSDTWAWAPSAARSDTTASNTTATSSRTCAARSRSTRWACRRTATADYADSNIDGVDRSDWSGDANVDADLSEVVQSVGNIASSELGGEGDVLG